MPTSVAQNNNYNPRVLEEHNVPSDYEQKKQRTTIALLSLFVIAGLVVWYIAATREGEMTPEKTLQNLAGSSAPVTTTAAERVEAGRVLENSSNKKTSSTANQRLQILNSLNQ